MVRGTVSLMLTAVSQCVPRMVPGMELVVDEILFTAFRSIRDLGIKP